MNNSFRNHHPPRFVALAAVCSPPEAQRPPPPPTRCRRGTMARPNRRSSTSCARPPSREPQFARRAAHRDLRPGRHAVGRAADVHAGDVRLDRVKDVVRSLRSPRRSRTRPCSRPGGDRAPQHRRHREARRCLAGRARHRGVPRGRARVGEVREASEASGPTPNSVYAPMVEAMEYLRANGYRTYIVTGGGQGVRARSPRASTAPPEQVIGHDVQGRLHGPRRQAHADQRAGVLLQQRQGRKAGRHQHGDRAPGRRRRSAT